MNALIQKIFPAVWNCIVILFVGAASLITIPKILHQFSTPNMTPDMKAMGYVGIGVLIGVWICGAAVMSFVWFRVPTWFRIAIGLVISVLAAGYFRAMVLWNSSSQAFPGPVDTLEALIFFGTIALFTSPLLLTGLGYPGIIQNFIRRRS